MKAKAIPIVLALALGLAGCFNDPAPQLRVLPGKCEVMVNQQISLALDGTIPQNAAIQWRAGAGSIVSAGLRVNALFTAPSTPGEVTITIVIDTATPNPPLTHTCIVHDNAPTAPSLAGTASGGGEIPSQTPLGPNGLSVIISEVMANPCGNEDFKKWNEYVELYNAGSDPVDVGGWWLSDNGPDTRADQLVAWNVRQPEISMGNVVTNSTIIPPGRFAVVLSPIYPNGAYPHTMPYRFPVGTILLTIAEGDRLGDDLKGIVGDGDGRDTLLLYTGGANAIKRAISTYGTPYWGDYPYTVVDNRTDRVPLDLKECHSAERKSPTAEDHQASWQQVPYGSPGEAPYP